MKQAGLQKSKGQLIWGIALVAVGIAVFVKISQVMPELEAVGQHGGLRRFGLYLIGVVLIGGGIKKIVAYVKSPVAKAGEIPDTNDNA